MVELWQVCVGCDEAASNIMWELVFTTDFILGRVNFVFNSFSGYKGDSSVCVSFIKVVHCSLFVCLMLYDTKF